MKGSKRNEGVRCRFFFSITVIGAIFSSKLLQSSTDDALEKGPWGERELTTTFSVPVGV